MNIEDYSKNHKNFILMHRDHIVGFAKYIKDSCPNAKFQYALKDDGTESEYVIVKFNN